MPKPPFINLHIGKPIIITPEDHAKMEREILARVMAGDVQMGDAIIAQLLLDNPRD